MMVRCTEIKIRGYHLDMFGHVNNSRYLELLEEGRWALFDNRVDFKQFIDRHVGFSVVNININFRRAAFLGSVLELYAKMEKIGEKSAVMYQEARMKDSGDIVADAHVTFVLTDLETGRAVPINEEFRGFLEKLGR
jgi:thioesterase-3